MHKTHRDFTRTLRIERKDFSLRCLHGEEWEMCERCGADWPRRHKLRLGVRCGGLYLFSGLLNEVTQVVLLNTFPISIMNHLLLIIPVQPKGGLLS